VLARHLQGRCLLLAERVGEGLALLDEAMLAVAGGTVGPLVTGIVYCSVIEGCRQVFALDRAREWTAALAAWCDSQPDLHAFTGSCLVHRAEILELRGAWPDALEEARRAAERLNPAEDPQACAAAWYQMAEVYRLRGDAAAAETAFRRSGETGWDPQPGLALLRLAQGQADAAEAAIRRVLASAANRVHRARQLPAQVEILLARGDVEAARRSCDELASIADALGTDMLRAVSGRARGAVALAEGDPTAALADLRRALQVWQRLEAPYHAARTRVLLAEACQALGDEEGARLERDAARTAFEHLGAAPDLTRLGAPAVAPNPHGLTRRELEVLRLLAEGKTNKAIADTLGRSVKTVDRHVSNIFDKLDVPSRAAATAFAYEHDLI
jgi:DNA-binding CsgD family transcriptional regulator